MSSKSVAIRIGTEGKAQVKSDFGEIRASGEAAFDGIGTSAREMTTASEAQFQRLAAGYDKAVAEIEAADRRRAASAEKMNAIVPKTAMQARIDSSVGSGYEGGSARERAQDLRALLLLEDQQEAQAAALRAAIDPLGAAQARYNAQLEQTRALQAAGKITGEEFAQAEAMIQTKLEQLAVTHQKGAAQSGAYRAGMQQLTYQLSDMSTMFALGAKPQQIFASQLGQTVGAVQLMAGEGTKLAAFLGNPWVQAAALATVVLGPLIANLIHFNDAEEDALEKLKQDAAESEVTRKAKERFALSYEGVTKAIDDQQVALGKSAEALKSEAQRNYEAAQVNRDRLIGIRETTQALLSQVIAQEQANAAYYRSANAAKDGISGAAMTALAQQRVRDAQAMLVAEDAEIAKAKQNVISTQSFFSVETGRKQADPLEVIKAKYDGPNGLIEQARKRAVAEKRTGDELQRQIALLEKQKQSDLDKERKKSGTSGSGEKALFGMPVSGPMTGRYGEARPGHTHAGIDIAVPVGTAVRAPATGTVIEAGTLPGYGNVVYIDHGGGTITRLAHLSRIDVTKGESIDKGAVIGLSGGARGAAGSGDSTGPHLHYEVRVNGKAVDPRRGSFAVDEGGAAARAGTFAERAAQDAERDRDRAIRNQREVEQANADLDAKILQIKRGGLTDLDAIAAFEKQQVDAEEAKYRAGIEAKVKLGDMSRADADILEAKRAQLAGLEKAEADRKAEAAKLRVMDGLQGELVGHQIDILQEQDRLAKTAAERREIELRILDLEKQEERRRYEQVIALGKRGEATAEQVQAAEDGLRQLDTKYDLRGEGVRDQTAGPLERYARDLDQSKQQIYERVESFAVSELDHFRQGLDDAITSKLHIKDPFLKQLIDLFIEQWLIKPITEAMAQAGSKMGSGGGGGGGFLGTLLSVGSSLFGGGGSGLSSAGGFDGGYDYSAIAFNAAGTENFSGGYTWLAENGPELVNLPRGSKVTPAAQTRRLLAGSNDNARPIVWQNFDFTGALTTEDVLRQARQQSEAAAQQAAQVGISELVDRNRRSFGGVLAAPKG